MTRQKKSRKTGTLGAKSQPKNLRQRKPAQPGKKPDKLTGKPPGNRHSIEPHNQAASATSGRSTTDPRIGSKRKVPLNLPTKDAPKADLTAQQQSMAEHPTARSTASNPVLSTATETLDNDGIKLAEDELARLENDPRLQDLLAQLDAGDPVSTADQAWVDEQLDRYRLLADQLGVDLDDYADEDDEEEPLEPWQKFENPKDWI